MGHLNWKSSGRPLWCLAFAAFLAVPARGAVASPSETAFPGAINYIEGEANIGPQALTSKSVGQVELQPGQSLQTRNGRAEVLLTPGVFLRLGHHSSVKMVSPSLINTRVDVTSGEVTVEVDELHHQNNLMIGQNHSTSYLVHTGFYDFDPQQGYMRVLKGQAVVLRRDRHIRVNGGHQVNLLSQNAKLKTEKFNQSAYKKENALYRWSKLRSQYLAEANVNAAPYFYNSGWYGPAGPWGWWGPGWYWNPWFDSYTFVPGGGVLFSPFGWGFYSPWSVGGAPYSIDGGWVRDFDHGSHNWGVRTGRHPFVARHAHGFVPGHEIYGPRGFGNHGEFHGGFRNPGVRGGFQSQGGLRGGNFGGGFHGGAPSGFHGAAGGRR
jgi:hypothetical protein